MIAEVEKIREAGWNRDDDLFALAATEGVRDESFRESLRKSDWGIKIIRALRRANIFNHYGQSPTAKGQLPVEHVPRVVSRFREFLRLHYPQESAVIETVAMFRQQSPETALRGFVLEFWIDPLPFNLPSLCQLNSPVSAWVIKSVIDYEISPVSYTRLIQRWGLCRVPQRLLSKASVEFVRRRYLLRLPDGKTIDHSAFKRPFEV